jgi:hypothetical protein
LVKNGYISHLTKKDKMDHFDRTIRLLVEKKIKVQRDPGESRILSQHIAQMEKNRHKLRPGSPRGREFYESEELDQRA